jgi:MFS family permease
MSQSQSSLKDASTPARQAGNVHGLVLLAAAVMPIMAITSIIPVLPLLLREFADVPGSAALVPVALTVPALCVALFSPIAGWLSDRIGRKRLLVGSLTIYAGCGFAPWFMESLTAIIASRVALGIVEAAIMTLTTALIGDYFEGERRERWIALQVAAASIAATVLLAAGGALGEALGSRGPFLLYLSALGIALAAAIVLHEPERGKPAEAAGASVLAHVLPLALITFGVGIVFYTILVQIGPILELSVEVSPGQVGLAGAAVNMGVVLGAAVFKRMSHLAGPPLLSLGLAVAAAETRECRERRNGDEAVRQRHTRIAGSGLLLPNLLGWTMRRLPQEVRGRGMGVWTGAFFLGQFVAPVATGVLAPGLGGLLVVIAAMAGLIALAALASAIFASMVKRQPEQPA